MPLGGAELDYLHGFVAHLDEQMERAVTLANVAPGARKNIAYFADGEEAYLGHRVCGAGNGDSAVNTLALGPTEATNVFDRLVPTSWNHNSFHPKSLGHDLLTRALVPWIRENVPEFGDATEFPATLTARAEPAPETAGYLRDPRSVQDGGQRLVDRQDDRGDTKRVPVRSAAWSPRLAPRRRPPAPRSRAPAPIDRNLINRNMTSPSSRTSSPELCSGARGCWGGDPGQDEFECCCEAALQFLGLVLGGDPSEELALVGVEEQAAGVGGIGVRCDVAVVPARRGPRR